MSEMVIEGPWEAAMMWSESTLLTTRQHSRLLLGKMNGFTFSRPTLFKKMVERLPSGAAEHATYFYENFSSHLKEILPDFTIVQLAMSHAGSLHLVKMHKDREPIVMPLAPKTKVCCFFF